MSPTESPLRIMLADDHKLFRRGLKALFAERKDMTIVAEANSGREAVDLARQLLPDVILMDIDMPEMDGLAATAMVHEEMPSVKIVMLTVSDYDRDLFDAIKKGASGYLLKDMEPEELFAMVLKVRRGEAAINGLLASRILSEFQGQSKTSVGHLPNINRLTDREIDVLERLVRGETNKEIADALTISENTVKSHLCNIMEKLHLRNRIEAAVYVVAKGLVKYGPDSAPDWR